MELQGLKTSGWSLVAFPHVQYWSWTADSPHQHSGWQWQTLPAGDTKILGAVNILEGEAATQKAENRLENWTHRNLMMFKDKCKSSIWDRITPCNSTSGALSSKHSCRKIPGNAGEQDEQESATCPSSGEGMTYEKMGRCVCSGPLKKGKGRNNCCTPLHTDGYRENGTRGFLEVHSKGLRQLTQKAEREIQRNLVGCKEGKPFQ